MSDTRFLGTMASPRRKGCASLFKDADVKRWWRALRVQTCFLNVGMVSMCMVTPPAMTNRAICKAVMLTMKKAE